MPNYRLLKPINLFRSIVDSWHTGVSSHSRSRDRGSLRGGLPSHSRLASGESLERRDCPAGFTLAFEDGSTVSNNPVPEGESAVYRVTMDAASTVMQSLQITTQSTTANHGTDYWWSNSKLFFFPGETEKTFQVKTLTTAEDNSNQQRTVNVFVDPIESSQATMQSRFVIVEPLANADSNFDIDVTFSNGAENNIFIQQAANQAAMLWESVIVGDLPDVRETTGGTIDDIVIDVQIGLLSGEPSDGTVLANAGPTAFRGSSSSGLPYRGAVGIDSDALLGVGQLPTIMVHEFAHALGFGLAEVFTDFADTTTNSFSGLNAVREYNQIFNPNTAPVNYTNVPLEDGDSAHWSETTFGNEIMTPTLDVLPNPLSRITVGAFADMGYVVDYGRSDWL
jgi:hypothetical protein